MSLPANAGARVGVHQRGLGVRSRLGLAVPRTREGRRLCALPPVGALHEAAVSKHTVRVLPDPESGTPLRSICTTCSQFLSLSLICLTRLLPFFPLRRIRRCR